jgi:hypothetical protein
VFIALQLWHLMAMMVPGAIFTCAMMRPHWWQRQVMSCGGCGLLAIILAPSPPYVNCLWYNSHGTKKHRE